MAQSDLDVVSLVERYVSPNLVPLLVALVALLATTLVALLLMRRADASNAVAAKAKPAFRAYTRAEVAAHSTPEDCWVIIKLKQHDDLRVFDVTEYIDEHPGGEAIFRNAGGDATGGFFGPHHPPRAHDMIEEFMIGSLAD